MASNQASSAKNRTEDKKNHAEDFQKGVLPVSLRPEPPEPEPPPADLEQVLKDELAARELADKKARVLEKLGQVYTVGRACRLAAVPLRDFRAWMDADEDFAASVDDIRQGFIDEMETRLIKMAKGSKTIKPAAFTPLIAFLNANHLSYGRVRAEMMERALIGFADQVMEIVQSRATKDIADAIRGDLLQAAFTACFAAGGKRTQRAGTAN